MPNIVRKKMLFAGIYILFKGVIAGLFAGIGLILGVSPDKGDFFLFVARNFCETGGDVVSNLGYNCWKFYSFLYFIVVLITFFSILGIIRKSKNVIAGIFFYLVGFLVGFSVIFFI